MFNYLEYNNFKFTDELLSYLSKNQIEPIINHEINWVANNRPYLNEIELVIYSLKKFDPRNLQSKILKELHLSLCYLLLNKYRSRFHYHLNEAKNLIIKSWNEIDKELIMHFAYLRNCNIKHRKTLIVTSYKKNGTDEDQENRRSLFKMFNYDKYVKKIDFDKRKSKKRFLNFIDNFEQVFLVGHGGDSGFKLANDLYLIPGDLQNFDFKKLHILGVFSCSDKFRDSSFLNKNIDILLYDNQSAMDNIEAFLYSYLSDYKWSGNFFSAFQKGLLGLLLKNRANKEVVNAKIMGMDYINVE